MKYIIVKDTKIVGIETHKFDTTPNVGEWIEVDDSLDIPGGSTWVDNALVLPDPPNYSILRLHEYPSIPDQLDEIYHNGIDSWKAVIKVTKDKYQKPS